MADNTFLPLFESISEIRIYKKGELIYSPDDEVDELFYIKSGSVKTGCYNEKGREITKFIFDQDELFGEIALVGAKFRRDYSYAIEESEILTIDLKSLIARIRENTDLSWYFINIIAARNIAYDERLESMVFKDSKTRIMDFLNETVEKNGRKVGYETVVDKFYTHQEIANITSTSRQTVTTILNILKNLKIITFDRKRLLVRDMQKLKEGFCE